MSRLKTFEIKSIHFEITGKCNLNCVYCYNSSFNSKKAIQKELTLREILSLISEAKRLGCEQFTFSGGEPFLKKDIFKIVEVLEGCYVAFLSNGKALNADLIKKIKEYPQIKEIKLSLDGYKSHNKLRKGSDYKHIFQVIKILKNEGIRVTINTLVLQDNLNEMFSLYLNLKDLHVDMWRVDIPFPFGEYKKNRKCYQLAFPKDYVREFKKVLKDYFFTHPSLKLEIFNLYKTNISPSNTTIFDVETHPCEYRFGSFPIRPNGDIIFCPSLDNVFSNYRKEGSIIKSLKKKYENKYYSLKVKDIEDCKNCRFLKICGTGCRANSKFYLKSIKAKDPLSCNLFVYWEKEILPILPKEIKNFYEKLLDKDGKYPKETVL